MGDSDVYWPVSSSDSSSESWVADSMDWGYESDETDPAKTIVPLNWVDYEEVESQASNEPEPTNVDTESFVGDSLEIPVTEHSTTCLLYTSPSPRDRQKSRMPSSA